MNRIFMTIGGIDFEVEMTDRGSRPSLFDPGDPPDFRAVEVLVGEDWRPIDDVPADLRKQVDAAADSAEAVEMVRAWIEDEREAER